MPPGRITRRVCASLALLAAPLGAQQITRATYYDYLPPFPRIVSQTRASAAFAVYGDRSDASYADADPADGIDDRRYHTLVALAERFSPILRPNNFSVPRDLEAIFGHRWTLAIDTWTTSGVPLSRDSLVAITSLSGSDRDSSDGPGVLNAASDSALLALLTRMSPAAPRRSFASAEGDADTVLFIDMPGTDARSWRAQYARRAWPKRSSIYSHVFVWNDTSAHRPDHFAFVLQYWFFYPFNDAVNEHEGDWEHVNVLITPRAFRARAETPVPIAGGPLVDSLTVTRILAGDTTLSDSLAIGAVDYYFHQNVVRIDYMSLAPNARPDSAVASDRRYFWEDVSFVRRAIADRLRAGGGRLATHPLVYVGGNNKGPDELLAVMPRFRGSFKRNSGSSYPFPGTWQTVAGFGVTETVNGRVTPHTSPDTSLSWDRLIDEPEFLTYKAADIHLLPDWERVERLVIERPEVRRRWAWLVLPIYWGFPATVSTGAGLVQHADLGNIAPPGPAYNDGWNRAGGPSLGQYQLRVLRTPVSPTTPWANLRNGWGFLNIPFAMWGLMPGYNVALIQLTPWMEGAKQFVGAPPPRTFTPGKLPRRFTSEGQGARWQFFGADYASLLQQNDPAVERLLAANPGSSIDEASVRRRMSVSPSFSFSLYFGERFALENCYAWSVGDVDYRVKRPDGSSVGGVAGTLKLQELTGGISYAVSPHRHHLAQPQLRAGYGWTHYSVERISVSGANGLLHGFDGGYLPPLLPGRRWWPNTLYAGGGLELFSSRRRYMMQRLGYGVRLDVTGRVSRLDPGADGIQRLRSVKRTDVALTTEFGW